MNNIIEMRAEGNTYYPVRQQDIQATEIAIPNTHTLATTETLAGDYYNKAKAFSLKTWQLSLLVGIAMYLIVVYFVDTPLLSLKAIVALVIGFAIVWLVSYSLDLFVSPSGIELYRTKRMFDLVKQEREERWRYYEKDKT